MQPNLKLRSNVFIRTDPDIRKDAPFRNQVRGRAALLIMLSKIGAGESDFQAARRLNLGQKTQYFLELRCSECGAIPEGPVRHGSVSYEFRCPGSHCAVNPLVVRHVDLDKRLAAECVQSFGSDLDATIRQALDQPLPDPLIPLPKEGIAFSCAVKLTRYQDLILKDRTLPELSIIINTALINLLREKKHEGSQSASVSAVAR